MGSEGDENGRGNKRGRMKGNRKRKRGIGMCLDWRGKRGKNKGYRK
jgi:hypothetical protein